MIFARIALLALVLGLVGCAGYTVGPIKPRTMENVRTIAVPTFRNDTLEPRVETLVTNAVIKQIQQDGTYQLASMEDADVILEGLIDDIDRRPQRGLRGNLLATREYQVQLKLRYRVVERVTGRLLEERRTNGQTSFFVSSTSNTIAADVLSDERAALPTAAEEAAQRLVSQIAEGW